MPHRAAAVVPLVLLGAACGSDEQPDRAARSQPPDPTTKPPAAPDPVTPPPAAPTEATPAKPAATGTSGAGDGAQRYVGLRSPDLLLELPPPLRGRGDRVLEGTSGLGLTSVGVEGGGELVFLDRRTDEGDFVVEAVLELPAGVTPEQLGWDDCVVAGKPDPHVVAVVSAGACEPPGAAAQAAWRVDPAARRFVPIEAADVRCVAMFCGSGAPGGAPGGT